MTDLYRCPHCHESFMVEKYMINHITIKHEFDHKWVNDEMFESGAVMMITNDNPEKEIGEEMRQQCSICLKVRYVPKVTTD